MIEVEEHVAKTVAAIPEHELRQLTAELLQRLKALDGTDYLNSAFPLIAQHWHEPWSPPS